MFDTVILDWSGTLVDDLEAVLHGTNRVFLDLGRPVFTRSEFRRVFDLPVESFYDVHLPGVPLDRIDRSFFQGFREKADSVAPFPFAAPFLEEAFERGIALHLLTTLDRVNAGRFLEEYGWRRHFQGIHAGVPDKIPYLRDLVRREGMKPRRTVFAGDLPHDIDAGRAAGVCTCAVLSGYGTRARLAAARPDLLLENLARLGRILRGEGEGVPA